MFTKQIKNIEKVIRLFVAELNKSIKVEKVILFGSYARNAQRDYSDIDILVVSSNFEGGTERDCRLLDTAARRINPLIEAIPCTPDDFDKFEKGDFIHEIRRTGKTLYNKAA